MKIEVDVFFPPRYVAKVIRGEVFEFKRVGPAMTSLVHIQLARAGDHFLVPDLFN